MTILLQWLVEHAWVFYAACAVGVIIYLLRAMAARRERSLALFTLERETATARMIRSWAMTVVFVIIGALIFFSTAFLLPALPMVGDDSPRPTRTLAAGVEPSTPGVAPSASPTLGLVVPTLTPTITATEPLAPAPAASEPTEVPTPVPTDTPEAAISGEVYARFGDFAELVGYSLPAADVTAGQPLPLTLYWRGLEGTSPTNYLVFTHLLSQGDGRLIAQHDGPPAGGTRPTGEWATGETIVDPHPMAFADPGYTGLATIAIGLYDPATGRIPTATGNDRVALPVTINVLPQ